MMKKTGRSEDKKLEVAIELDIPDDIVEVVFPGGEKEIKREVNKLSLLLPKTHPKDLIQFVLIASSVYFGRSEDKSEGKLIAYIQEMSQSRLTAQEGKIVHDFIYERALRVHFSGEVEELDFDDLH